MAVAWETVRLVEVVRERAPDGYSVEREGAHAVALDLTIDVELRDEGRAREIVHAARNERKNAGPG
jgi:hypothetical protein